MTLVGVFEWIGFAAFVAAAVVAATRATGRRMGSAGRYALVGALLTYALDAFSNALEHSGITQALDPVEDVVEILFILLILFFLYSFRTERMLDEIRARAERFRVTLASIGDGILVTDDKGRITQLNPAMEEMLGTRLEALRGRDARSSLRFLDGERGELLDFDPIGRVIATRAPVAQPAGTWLQRADGTAVLVAENAAPILDDQQQVIGAVAVLRDITEQEALAEQLRQSQKMDAIGQLAGGVAHDFNNMLGGIMGAAEVLEEELGPDHGSLSLVTMITDATRRAADLTGKLLAFSRKRGVLSTAIEIHAIIDEALALFERTIDRRIALTREFHPEPLVVVGDPQQIQNAVLNLAINARDAMPDGGDLVVTTARVPLDATWCDTSPFDLEPGQYVRISVRDTGEGISAELQQRIFEPFFTTKGEHRGTGLGLAAVYGTMASHHGACALQSEPGAGTRFELYFPLADESAVRTAPDPEPVEPGSGCVLVVDDEEMIRTTAKMILTAQGYEVLLAGDGQEGVDAFRRHADRISVVVLDVVMPRMSGRDAFRAMREIDPDVRVILASGFVRDRIDDEGLAGFIGKPFSRHELLSTVQDARRHRPDRD